MNLWTMNQWINESVNQPWNEWTNEPMSHWINEPTNQESMSQWRNEWTNEVMDGWMDGWMDEWATFLCWATSSLGDVFAEAPLLSATSLSSHLSGQPLLSSASQLALLQLLQPTSSVCAAVTMRLTPSSCNPAYQEFRSITHALPRAAVPVRFVTTACKPE